MRAVLHRLMAALTIFAFIGGMSVQAIPSAGALGLTGPAEATKADMDCPRMAAEHPDRSVPKPIPCKGIMLDCVKQMGCLGTPALPDRADAVSVPVAYSMVAYWSPGPVLSGRDVEPDLFPPIAG
jgi:hypothetical protein